MQEPFRFFVVGRGDEWEADHKPIISDWQLSNDPCILQVCHQDKIFNQTFDQSIFPVIEFLIESHGAMGGVVGCT
jgi:hypothetical protein